MLRHAPAIGGVFFLLGSTALVGEAAAAVQWSAVEEAKLTVSGAGDIGFGRSVSVSGDTAVVGAPWDPHAGGAYAGSAYVFVRSGTGWTQEAKLTASDAAPGDEFGKSVAISGDTVVVGAPGADGVSGDAGAAFVFERSGTSWSEVAKLAAWGGEPMDYFGVSVSVSGDTAVVGAWWNIFSSDPKGAAFVYVRTGGIWGGEARMTASDGQDWDHFGASVAVSGNRAVIGTLASSAYVYTRTGTLWSEEAKLTASGAGGFGGSVSIAGTTAVVGAQDSAYVFVGSWIQEAKLTPGAATGTGSAVAVSGDTAVVGVSAEDHAGGQDAGSVYVFVRTGASWSEEVKLTASDAEAEAHFGRSVAVSGDTVVAGALTESAYVYRLCPAPVTYCTAGTSASGCNARVSACGTASATAASGFTLSASTVEGNKAGLFFFGTNGQQANPWGDGTSFQCVVPPVKRGGLLTAAGTPGLCDGSFAQDLNALWCATCPKPLHNPGAGAVVQAQLWYRDPQNTSNQTTSLSDAIQFTVGP